MPRRNLRRRTSFATLLIAVLFTAYAASIVHVWILDAAFTPIPSPLLGRDQLDSSSSAPNDRSHPESSIVGRGEACLYAAWQRYIPPLITTDDNSSVRHRYDTLPHITTTDPIPFTNVVLRSSFKAGFSFMHGFVRALYEGNETRQRWLKETRRRHPRRQHPGPWEAVVFLRDPIDRFKSIYAQMLKFSNRKYHWYGDGDAHWLGMPEGPDRVRTFVASVKRRFYNEHLLPQLWFLSDSPEQAPNLTFVGRLERLLDDWDAMAASLGLPDDVVHDAYAFLHNRSSQPDHVRNANKNSHAKSSVRHAMYEDPDANATLLDICNTYRPDFACFNAWLPAPSVCKEAWRKDEQ